MWIKWHECARVVSNTLLNKSISERKPMSTETAIIFFENMHHESMTNQTRWHTNRQPILVWKRLGAAWGRSWSPSKPKGPPRCTLGCENHVRGSPFGDGFLYNLHYPELHLMILCAISETCSNTFGEFLEEARNRVFCNSQTSNYGFRGSRASIVQSVSQSFSDSIPALIFIFFINCWVARAPFWSQWARFAHTKKTKKVMWVYAGVRGRL